MLLLRLLAIFLVLITNTWLLNPVRSDALGRHKRAMAQRADRELSRLAGEPCTVSGAWRSRRQLRSLPPSQHRPPAARTRTHTSRREPDAEKSAPTVCAGGCRFDTGGQLRGEEEKKNWIGVEEHHIRPTTEDGGPTSVSDATGLSPVGKAGEKKAEVRAQTSRLARSLRATPTPALLVDTEVNSTTDNSSLDLRGPQQVLHKPQRDYGDQQSAPDTLGAASSEDYSGEVEEADKAAASAPVGGAAAPWGSPVPHAPASWMTALYFSGRREQLKLKPAPGFELPRSKLSVGLWVKPEGGQSNPAVIAGG